MSRDEVIQAKEAGATLYVPNRGREYAVEVTIENILDHGFSFTSTDYTFKGTCPFHLGYPTEADALHGLIDFYDRAKARIVKRLADIKR